MLLGVEKRRSGEEELQSVLPSTSGSLDAGISGSEDCKDVIECLSLTIVQSEKTKMADHGVKEVVDPISRFRHEEGSSMVMNYESGQENVAVAPSAFEFYKADRVAHRLPLVSFSKPAPSKWDNAQKWIASPTYNVSRNGQSQPQQGNVSRAIFSGYGNRQLSSKIEVEIPEEKSDDDDEEEEEETKRIDLDQTQKEFGGQKIATWDSESFPIADSYAITSLDVNLSRLDSGKSVLSAATFIPPSATVKSISMRDVGTEMTPIPSTEPSRISTPVRPATPLRSPNTSRPTTPESEAVDHQATLNKSQLSDTELRIKTRREILALGKRLGKINIAAWASKAEEDKELTNSVKTIGTDFSIAAKTSVETRSLAWEEAEKSKYNARYEREKIRIEVWENLQKAKAEAEMRKREVEIERIRARVHEKLVNKLAALRHKAETKRVAAEEKRSRQAARTEEQAERIRRTGKFPSWVWSCCACSCS